MNSSAGYAEKDAQVVRCPSRIAAGTVCTKVIAREASELEYLTLMTTGCCLGIHDCSSKEQQSLDARISIVAVR